MKIAQDQQDRVKINIFRWLEEENYKKRDAMREKQKRRKFKKKTTNNKYQREVIWEAKWKFTFNLFFVVVDCSE